MKKAFWKMNMIKKIIFRMQIWLKKIKNKKIIKLNLQIIKIKILLLPNYQSLKFIKLKPREKKTFLENFSEKTNKIWKKE